MFKETFTGLQYGGISIVFFVFCIMLVNVIYFPDPPKQKDETAASPLQKQNTCVDNCKPGKGSDLELGGKAESVDDDAYRRAQDLATITTSENLIFPRALPASHSLNHSMVDSSDDFLSANGSTKHSSIEYQS